MKNSQTLQDFHCFFGRFSTLCMKGLVFLKNSFIETVYNFFILTKCTTNFGKFLSYLVKYLFNDRELSESF